MDNPIVRGKYKGKWPKKTGNVNKSKEKSVKPLLETRSLKTSSLDWDCCCQEVTVFSQSEDLTHESGFLVSLGTWRGVSQETGAQLSGISLKGCSAPQSLSQLTQVSQTHSQMHDKRAGTKQDRIWEDGNLSRKRQPPDGTQSGTQSKGSGAPRTTT